MTSTHDDKGVEINKAEPTKMARVIKWVGVVLMFEWAVIHMFAGIVSMASAYPNDLAAYAVGICQEAPEDEVARTNAVSDWSLLVKRILIQHAWNLLFVGIHALVLAAVVALKPIPRGAMFYSLFPWMFDMGFLIGIEIPAYANALSSAQTYFLAVAIACINYTVKERFGDEVPLWEYAIGWFCASSLFGFGLILAIVHAAGGTPSG